MGHPVPYNILDAARMDWRPEDPEIVSDVLFAVANVMSIARTTYLMPAFEVLGPLQISLGRMLGDITRFLVLFTLVRTAPQASTQPLGALASERTDRGTVAPKC